MKVLLLSFVLVLSVNLSFAASSTEPPIGCSQSQLSNSLDIQIVQKGCCSHHGGVCGCSGGTAMCCDGNPSPTCGCHADDVNEFLKSSETEQPKS